MSGGLAYALARLSDRERGLLLLLGAVVVPVAIAFLVVMPLIEARDRAARSLSEAEAMRVWVAEQVKLLPPESVGEATTSLQPAEPIGITGIEESLVRIDLRDFVTQLANRDRGGVDLTLENAPFDRLGDWLLAMAPRWGYEVSAFRIDATDPGLVNASFELEPAL